MFLTRREPGVPLSLFRPYPLPFSPPFLLYCSLPFLFLYAFFIDLVYICCSFRGGILSVVFRTVATCLWPAGNLECPCLFSDLILFPFLLPFSYIVPCPSFSSMSFSLIYICCSLILFPFLLLFFSIVPYPSCSSMSFSLIYICCSFRGGILSVVFPTVARCFWPAGNLECPCPFPTLSSSLLSSFSSILFLTLPFLLCLFHWSISAVVSGEAFYLLFSPL